MKPTTTTGRKLGDEGDKNAALSVSPDELQLASAVFCFVHRECDAAYAHREGDTVELRCGLCGEFRVYKVNEPNFEPSIEIRSLFSKPTSIEPGPSPRGMAF